MAGRPLLLLLVAVAIVPHGSNAFLDVLLKDDMVQLFLGTSTPFYLVEQGYDSQLARSGILRYLDPLAPERSQLTFEWSSKKPIHYVIQVNSGNTRMMEHPKADILLRGKVPSVETEFHINFPCTFQQSGTTFVAITFTFFDERGSPMYRMPFTLAMKRACIRAERKVDLQDHKVQISELPDAEKETLADALGNDLQDVNKERLAPIAVVVQPKGRDPAGNENTRGDAEDATQTPIPVFPASDNSVEQATLSTPVTQETAQPKSNGQRVSPPLVESVPVIEACPMCIMPKTEQELKTLICKAGFAIRSRLFSLGSDTKTNHFFLGLRDYRELRPSRRSASNALYAWEHHNEYEEDASEKVGLTTNEPMRVRVMVGARGRCSCNGRINNQDFYLVAGKYSSRRGQLVIRQNKSLLLPWREAKHMFRRLRPLSCNK